MQQQQQQQMQQQQQQQQPALGQPAVPMMAAAPPGMGVPPGMHAQGNLGGGVPSQYKSRTELEAARKEEERVSAERAQARFMAEKHALAVHRSEVAANQADAAKRERMGALKSTAHQAMSDVGGGGGGGGGGRGGVDSGTNIASLCAILY